MTFRGLKTSVLAALLAASAVSAQAATAHPFVLEGYESLQAPRLIRSGRYEEIIARSSRHAVPEGAKGLPTLTNLCVAYIKTVQLTQARTACDQAIAAASTRRPSGSIWQHVARERALDLARSYSNRAVLHWVNGDRAAAEADVAMAATYAPAAHFVVTNAAALSARGSKDTAITSLAGR